MGIFHQPLKGRLFDSLKGRRWKGFMLKVGGETEKVFYASVRGLGDV